MQTFFQPVRHGSMQNYTVARTHPERPPRIAKMRVDDPIKAIGRMLAYDNQIYAGETLTVFLNNEKVMAETH